MNPTIFPEQSNTQEGVIVVKAAVDLREKEAHLALLDSDGAAILPLAATAVCLYVILSGGNIGEDVELLPLASARNVRLKTGDDINAGDRLVVEAGGKVVALADGAAGANFSPGVAEVAADDGYLVLARPMPAIAIKPIAFTGATPAATAATNSTPYGFSQTQADALIANVRELRAWAIAAGFMSPNA